MDQRLDLSLPPSVYRPPPRLLAAATLLAVLACLGLLVLLAVRRGLPGAPNAREASGAESAERLRGLAESLERRTLYGAAADVWAEYSSVSSLAATEAAEMLYRRGKCLREAARYEEAARAFTELEVLPLDRETKRNANRMLLECLSALGKEEARGEALKAFTSPGTVEKGTAVARIGGDEVTLEDVRQDFEHEMRLMLRATRPDLAESELAVAGRDAARERLKDPKAAAAAIQRAVSLRVLEREGLARGHGQGSDYDESLRRFRRSHLAERVVAEALESAARGISPTDLKNHFEAKKTDYVEKPSVEFSFLRASSEDEAKSLLSALAAGGDAAAAVLGRFTRSTEPAVEGGPVPGIGASAESSALLLSLEEGRISERAVRAGEAWYAFRADRKRPERQLTYAEAEERVRGDLLARKRQEAVEKLQAELGAKFVVEIVDAERLKQALDESPKPSAPAEAKD